MICWLLLGEKGDIKSNSEVESRNKVFRVFRLSIPTRGSHIKQTVRNWTKMKRARLLKDGGTRILPSFQGTNLHCADGSWAQGAVIASIKRSTSPGCTSLSKVWNSRRSHEVSSMSLSFHDNISSLALFHLSKIAFPKD